MLMMTARAKTLMIAAAQVYYSEIRYRKIVKVIESCKTLDQINVASDWLMRIETPDMRGIEIMGYLAKKRMGLFLEREEYYAK